MVSSSEKPKNSPIYSIHTDLDSFILYNDESSNKPELEDNDLDNQLEAPNLEIMAVLGMEEKKRETFEQCVETTNQSEQSQDGKQQTTHHAELYENPEERDPSCHVTDLRTEHNDEQGNRDENDVNPTNNPLWCMKFDGSCTKKSAGAGVWLVDTEKNYSESHAFKLDFKCTNNIVEYEALILGLRLLKELGAKKIIVQGDSKLVIK